MALIGALEILSIWGAERGEGGVRVDQVQEMNKINAEIEQKQSWESPVALKAQPVSTVLR